MINVTRPYMPDLNNLLPLLEAIWESGILSNSGALHQQFEAELQDFLGVPHVSLFCNATTALMVAQRALNVRGEVITTPYSFAATAHALDWMGNKPIFVDIERESLTIDPEKVEAAITPDTRAIMPLHCYGNLCNTEALAELAQRYDLKIIYDACHSFGVEDSGGSVLRHGEVSVVSFHATKVFHTFEGGLVATNSASLKKKIDLMKNFGFETETSVVETGINGKMSEFNAAVGLLQIRAFPEVIRQREERVLLYRSLLAPVRGIHVVEPWGQAKPNHAYFPILVTQEYPLTRDALYERLKAAGYNGRRYFYPLITEFPAYADRIAGRSNEFRVATEISKQVICLPLYPDLDLKDVAAICQLISEG